MRIDSLWYKPNPLRYLLLPFTVLYRLTIRLRRYAYASGLIRTGHLPVPVIVVGNITVGGTGKTPFVIWLVDYLRKRGFRPGVISRGYGGQSESWPQAVSGTSDPSQVGDEPVLIAQQTAVPIFVGPDRIAAAEALLDAHPTCSIIVSDDGLQHYALGRDIEIVIIDGQRGFGNGLCLPAGPLREPITRLRDVDIQISNGTQRDQAFTMHLQPRAFCSLDTNENLPLDAFSGKKVHAAAGIGNPDRFFSSLRSLGCDVVEHPFPDHAAFSEEDFDFVDNAPIIITEKDAVKCRSLALENVYYLRVDAELDVLIETRLQRLLSAFQAT